MFTNWQIYQEASYIFYTENRFIRIRFSDSSYFTPYIRNLGLAKAIRRSANNCNQMIMTTDIHLDDENDIQSLKTPVDLVLAQYDLALLHTLILYDVLQRTANGEDIEIGTTSVKISTHDTTNIAVLLIHEWLRDWSTILSKLIGLTA